VGCLGMYGTLYKIQCSSPFLFAVSKADNSTSDIQLALHFLTVCACPLHPRPHTATTFPN
jgi:hypothetical protein